jgi:hypothetical protein
MRIINNNLAKLMTVCETVSYRLQHLCVNVYVNIAYTVIFNGDENFQSYIKNS